MKKNLILLAVLFTVGTSLAQVYTPIVATGYTLDAVAENTTAASTTGGSIDGSDYVMYSHAYGLLYNANATGLPDNGAITVGTRSYQLQPFTGANVFYLPATTEDSLQFTTPAAYPAVSLLGFSTEGAGTMSVTLRFVDNTTQTFTNVPLADWFGTTTTAFYAGFDRCGRTTGTPGNATTTPKFYTADLRLLCTNLGKLVKNIKVKNTTTGARLVIMAVAGAANLTTNIAANPASCLNGTDGSATLTPTGGLPPFTYTWTGTPVQGNAATFGLAAGVTTVTIKDAAGCITQTNVLVNVSSVPLPALSVASSTNAVCAGKSLTLSVAGAINYLWSINNATTTSNVVTPLVSTVYNVTGTNSAGCQLNGNVVITVNALPVPTFTTLPAVMCVTQANLPLTADPMGGTFSGPGVNFNTFYTASAGPGTHTLVYTYTDANGCAGSTSSPLTVAANTISIAFSLASSYCSASPTVALNATPAGGAYSGPGVSNGVFNPSMGVGTRTVSYTYTDANTCTAKAVISTIVSQCNGINQLSAASAVLSLYPNPATTAVNIKSDVSIALVVINELGQPVRTLKLDDNNGRQTTLENLPAGIYFVQSTDASYSVKQKLVITK